MPGPQKSLEVGRLDSRLGRVDLENGVLGRDERVVAALYHFNGQDDHEYFGHSVEVEEQHVVPTPTHEVDCV